MSRYRHPIRRLRERIAAMAPAYTYHADTYELVGGQLVLTASVDLAPRSAR